MHKVLNIKLLRKYLGLKQDEICEDFKISRSTWSNYERTNSFPIDVVREVEQRYKAEIIQLGDKVMDVVAIPMQQDQYLIRIKELETLIQQKDIIIENQRQVIEMMNKTFELQKAQKNSKL